MSSVVGILNRGNSDGRKTYLLNHDGFYLAHPDKSKEWGFELNHDERLGTDYSSVAAQMLGGEAGVVQEGGDVLALRPCVPNRSPANAIGFWSKPSRKTHSWRKLLHFGILRSPW